MNNNLGRALGFTIAVLLLPLALPVVVVDRIAHVVTFIAWQIRFGRGGERALAVYSDGPKWKAHFESEVLPLIQGRAVVVNTTATPSWSASASLARRVHRRWGGHKHHSPIVVFFPKLFGKVRVIRFHEGYLRRAHNGDASVIETSLATLKVACDDA